MCGYFATFDTIFALEMKYREIWSKNAAASDSTDWISAKVSSCTETPKLLPSSIFGIKNEIHIFKRFESSTNARITGFTILMMSQMGTLQLTVPDGNASTLVPPAVIDTSTALDELDSTRDLLLAGAPSSLLFVSPTWFNAITLGTGMLRAYGQWNGFAKIRDWNHFQFMH